MSQTESQDKNETVKKEEIDFETVEIGAHETLIQSLIEANDDSDDEGKTYETFEDLGLHPDLLKIIKKRNWEKPTKIQIKTIPHALKGRDIIGLAVTGSGKTGAFLLPILNSIITNGLASLNRFKSSKYNILVSTEVSARGLDLPDVNQVINFDVPTNYKDYIHRVGRTARAGKHGVAFTFVTKNDVVQYKSIEIAIFGDNKEAFPPVYEKIKDEYELVSNSMNLARLKSQAEKEFHELLEKKKNKKSR
ncbi:putative ATP-dependent RNA helicase T26G10.1 [Dermatophagoides farinae]|uniref:putative ATP-dependent RNA helicase T26G10.1 n=1 Tax=Dermatophagoides farinae TaxID=6954 RepID=UPI003F5F4546